MNTRNPRRITRFSTLIATLFIATRVSAADLELNARSRTLSDSGASYHETHETLTWDPNKTAIVVCDMWN